MRIDIIANTNARVYRRDFSTLAAVRKVATGRADVHATNHVDELDAICDVIAKRGSDLVVLSGGDGSFMAGVTALVRAFGSASLPRLALLPGGTVATVARNFGLQGSPVDLLQRLLSRPTDFVPKRSATLRVRQTLGDQTIERIGFIFGTGLVARFFDIYYADGARGYGGAARITARIFVDSFYGGAYSRVLTPMPCSIEADGAQLAGQAWSLVCAAVVRDLGIGMKVNYRAGESLDRVHLVASQLPPHKLAPRCPRVLMGKNIGGPGHVDDLFRSFVVRFAPEGPFVLDGDMLRASEVHVSAGPTLDLMTLPT
ncbi:MAG TPA: diacylglycerol kinase family protein [Polyangium sp.]|nr:diacylglycerol kinase family protein [Polyangium sp.]